MLNAAIVGDPIDHSLSPSLHMAAYEYLGVEAKYQKFVVHEGELTEFLEKHPELNALSVTMPNKFDAYQVANTRDDFSTKTKASNTLVISQTIKAYNTDVYGILESLKSVLSASLWRRQKTVAILGAGATALSALCAADQLGYNFVTVYLRDFRKATNFMVLARRLGIKVDLKTLGETITEDIVISTLPGSAIKHYLSSIKPQRHRVFLDVNYNPWPTPLAQLAEKQDAPLVSGLEMLLHQAVQQVGLFTGLQFDKDKVLEVMRQSVRK
ncbi:MAG: shikimate dehydrogenase [Micrococcaceae bacterium]